VGDAPTRPAPTGAVIPLERIQQAIYLMRGQKVVLSSDLAVLYQVQPRALVQAVKRNRERFPDDFMFQLTSREWVALKSQTVISNAPGRGGRRTAPYAFTQEGVAMLSGVLNSARAIAVNVQIMRAFVRLRELLATHADLARTLAEMESKYDGQFRVVFDALGQLMVPPALPAKPPIGFNSEARKAKADAKKTLHAIRRTRAVKR